MEAIIESLKNNSTLTELALRGGYIHNELIIKIGIDGILWVGNDIGEEAAKKLDDLRNTSCLKNIYFTIPWVTSV